MSKTNYSYLVPKMKCSAKLFLKNGCGNHIKWSKKMYKEGDRCYITKCNNGFALELRNCDQNQCRETLCNDFREVFNNNWYGDDDDLGCLTIPFDRIITLSPPRATSGKLLIPSTSSLFFSIKAPRGAGENPLWKHNWENRYSTEVLFGKACELARVKKNQAQLFEMMDVLLGSVAMLIAGPEAYTQKAKNKTFPAKKSASRGWKRGTPTTAKKLKMYQTTLEYSGISNFWLKHPAVMSFILGLARFTLDAWCEDMYEGFDKALDLVEARKYLKELSKDRVLEHTDREELLGVLKTLKPFLLSPKVEANLGAFPLNEYTWGMFSKLARYDFEKEGLSQAWKLRENGIYSEDSTYGFYKWCEDQKNKTKKFSSYKKWGWGDENYDNQILV